MSAITLSFANNKGGVGKTTTTLLMGQAFARMGKRVLFIDFDSQANLTIMTEGEEPRNYDLTIADALVDSKVEPIIKVSDNLDIIPSNLSLSGFEGNSSITGPDRFYRLLDLVEKLRDRYDFILVDCPPALGILTYNAFIASDYLVMVSTPSELSILGLNMIYKMYKEIRSNVRLNPKLQLAGTIVNMFEKNRSTASLFLKKIEADPGLMMIRPVIKKAIAVEKASALRMSLFEYAPDADVTSQYIEVAENLMARILTDQAAK